MKKLLLIFLLLPTFAFSETWRCVDDKTSEEFNYESFGGHFKWVEASVDEIFLLPVRVENDTYIFLRRDSFHSNAMTVTSIILNKKSQTFSHTLISSDLDSKGIANDRPSSASGRCDVYEGKKVTP